MARRRRFYARDSHGRFSKTAGRGGQYRKKISTRRKVAYAAGGVALVGAAAYGGRELYRSGARKGWDVGKKQGIYEGKPLRGKNGRIRPNAEKLDFKQNPFARGYRPVGKNNAGRRNARIGTRIRATNVAVHKADQNFAAGRSRIDGMHIEKRVKGFRNSVTRNASKARAYNDAQSRSQKVGNAARRAGSVARTAGGRAVKATNGVDVRKLYSSAPRRNVSRMRTNARINSSIISHNVRSTGMVKVASQRVTNARINSAVVGQQVRSAAATRRVASQKRAVKKLRKR